MAVLSTRRIGKLAFEVESERHKLVSDVADSLGGEDLGADPHALLETSLAACTAITLQMYAARKNLPLESSDVTIRIVEEGKTNRIERKIRLLGPLSDEQRTLLLEIANKCPMHKFISAGAAITSSLV